jgi:ClpP class serine protease
LAGYQRPQGVPLADRHRRVWDRMGFLAMHRAAWGQAFDVVGAPAKPFQEVGAVAVVCVDGPLYQRLDPWGWCDSYEAIGDRARAAFASSATTVLLRINSPGGDAAGCMELSRELRAMARASGKRLVAYVDGMCASAAYAIACAADWIYAPPTSSVGSIGVFEAVADVTEQDAAMGVKIQFRASGKRKLDGNPHVPTSTETLDAMQSKVDLLAGLFFDLVAEQRGVEASAVEGIEGALLLAAQAKESGLIDSIEVYAALVEALQVAPQENPKMATPKNASAAVAIMAAFMGAGPKAKATDKEWEALQTLAESDDEENRKAASKMLKRMMGGDEPDGDEDKAKAEADEKEKKDKEEADAKAKAEADEKKDAEAKALAANALVMAQELQTLKAQNAERDARDATAKEQAERSRLFATRPDFSAAQRATLSLVPLEALAKACKEWPRASADPGSSASALTAGGGEILEEPMPLNAEQQALIARLDHADGGAKALVVRGSETSVPIYDRAVAQARLDAKRAQGKVA